MPWTASDGPRLHTKKARSLKARKQWASVANSVLRRTGDEGRAVRTANAVVKRRYKKRSRSRMRVRR